MNVITANFLGRFGNQAMQYTFARAYAEKHGCEFQCEPWIGQRVFQLDDKSIEKRLPRYSELDLKDGQVNINFYGYAQNQRCMIYTREQAQNWFKIRPEIEEALKRWRPEDDSVIAHRRAGDYLGYGYVQVSKKSYHDACQKFGLDVLALRFVSDESPGHHLDFPDELSFLPDFYRLMKAPTLLRGNSSFSWFAALLSNAEIYSPVIEGLAGGKEHDCDFVPGNHPRFCNLAFVTDLHVKENETVH